MKITPFYEPAITSIDAVYNQNLVQVFYLIRVHKCR